MSHGFSFPAGTNIFHKCFCDCKIAFMAYCTCREAAKLLKFMLSLSSNGTPNQRGKDFTVAPSLLWVYKKQLFQFFIFKISTFSAFINEYLSRWYQCYDILRINSVSLRNSSGISHALHFGTCNNVQNCTFADWHSSPQMQYSDYHLEMNTESYKDWFVSR
jgi:hypothetical protein